MNWNCNEIVMKLSCKYTIDCTWAITRDGSILETWKAQPSNTLETTQNTQAMPWQPPYHCAGNYHFPQKSQLNLVLMTVFLQVGFPPYWILWLCISSVFVSKASRLVKCSQNTPSGSSAHLKQPHIYICIYSAWQMIPWAL